MDGITVTAKTEPIASQEPSVEAEAPASLPVNSDAAASLLQMEVAQQLGVRDISNTKFQFVFEQLSKDNPDKGDLLQTMRGIQTKLGLPRFGHGESHLSVLYSYLKAQHTLDQALKVKNSYLL